MRHGPLDATDDATAETWRGCVHKLRRICAGGNSFRTTRSSPPPSRGCRGCSDLIRPWAGRGAGCGTPAQSAVEEGDRRGGGRVGAQRLQGVRKQARLAQDRLRRAIAGDDEAEPDPRRKLSLYGSRRRRLATSHPAAGPRRRGHQPRRPASGNRLRAGTPGRHDQFARALHQQRHLRPAVSVDEARDMLWTCSRRSHRAAVPRREVPRFRSRSTGSSLHRSSIDSTSPAGRASIASRNPIESGLRWEELTELRLRDLHLTSGIVTVSRGVSRTQARRFTPCTGRFCASSASPGARRAWCRRPRATLPPLHGSGMRLIAASYSPCSDRQRHTADTSGLCVFSDMEYL